MTTNSSLTYAVLYSQQNGGKFVSLKQKKSLDGLIEINLARESVILRRGTREQNADTSTEEESEEGSDDDDEEPTTKKSRVAWQKHKRTLLKKVNKLKKRSATKTVVVGSDSIPQQQREDILKHVEDGTLKEGTTIQLMQYTVEVLHQATACTPKPPQLQMQRVPTTASRSASLVKTGVVVGKKNLLSSKSKPLSAMTRKPPLQPKKLVQTTKFAQIKRQPPLLPAKRKVSVSLTKAQRPQPDTIQSPPRICSTLPHIPLPGSIRSKLRPHQVTGVDFLWKALTTTQELQKQKGAILADEMGLGKTLMTIAVICALFRRQREKVLTVCFV